MKARYIVALLAVLFVTTVVGRFVIDAYAANEAARFDGTHEWSSLCLNSSTLETLNYRCNSSGALLVDSGTSANLDDFEEENYFVSGNSDSGTNLNPASAANSFSVCNAVDNTSATSVVFVRLDATAANDVGRMLDAGSCWGWDGITFSTFSVYVDGAAGATISVYFGRDS